MTAEDKIRRALIRLKQTHKIAIPEILEKLLPACIAEEFGGPDVFVYCGWTCMRIAAEKVPREHWGGRKPADPDRYGYVCTKGGDEKYLYPSTVDVTMEYTKRRIDFWEEWFKIKGDYNGVTN